MPTAMLERQLAEAAGGTRRATVSSPIPRSLSRVYSRQLERSRRQIINRMSRKAARYLRNQSREVVSAYRAHLDPVDVIDLNDVRLLTALTPDYRGLVTSIGGVQQRVFGISASIDAESILESAGERIVTMQGATKNAVREQLRFARRHRLSQAETEGLIRGAVYMSQRGQSFRDVLAQRYRAERIARTETAIASNQATREVYRREGIGYIEVIDGPGCGVYSHDDGSEANGMIITMQEAASFPDVSHPNCARAFSPIVDDLSAQEARNRRADFVASPASGRNWRGGPSAGRRARSRPSS